MAGDACSGGCGWCGRCSQWDDDDDRDSSLAFEDVDALGELGDDFGQLPDESSEADGAIGFESKAVWGGGAVVVGKVSHSRHGS